MRYENVWCDECGKTHFVQVMRSDRKGRIIKTKCHGADFMPIINDEKHYTRHKLRGFDVIRKSKPAKNKSVKGKVKPVFIDLKIANMPPTPERKCLAEISMSIRGRMSVFKVFADATPDKFYEVFFQVGDKPAMIKPRDVGTGKPIPIGDLPRFFSAESHRPPIFHNRAAYEKLLTVDYSALILERNHQVVASMSLRTV